MIFKNFADQDWIGHSFIGSGLDSDWKISQSAHLCYLHGRASKCGRREFWRQKSSVQLNQNENVGAACLHGASERLGWVFCAAVLG